MGLPTTADNTIVGRIKTRLGAITTGSEYYYTYGAANVYDNHPNFADLFSEDSKTKAINIRDTLYERLGENFESSLQVEDIAMTVEIDLIYRGSDAAATIRKMNADVLKSIGQDLTWSGDAFHTVYVSSQRNRMDAYGKVISDLTITIIIQYRKTQWSI